MGKTAYQIVADSRKKLVDKIVVMMEEGKFLNSEKWDRGALNPHNPISGTVYRGGNKFRLMDRVLESGYKDPRWMTRNQLIEKGYYIKKEERFRGTLCECWKFEKEIKKKVNGETIIEKEKLDPPRVYYFTVYNAEQVKDFPPLPKQDRFDNSIMQRIDDFASCSECKIQELGQSRAMYSPDSDIISLPLREYFKSETSFGNTVIHEMAHSTGHATRLNRDLYGDFGSERYAKEELRAELSSLFVGADLELPVCREHYEDHSNYLRSWIGTLKNDYNELFRACADAEKISERLMDNYAKKYNIDRSVSRVEPAKEKTVDDKASQEKPEKKSNRSKCR